MDTNHDIAIFLGPLAPDKEWSPSQRVDFCLQPWNLGHQATRKSHRRLSEDGSFSRSSSSLSEFLGLTPCEAASHGKRRKSVNNQENNCAGSYSCTSRDPSSDGDEGKLTMIAYEVALDPGKATPAGGATKKAAATYPGETGEMIRSRSSQGSVASSTVVLMTQSSAEEAEAKREPTQKDNFEEIHRQVRKLLLRARAAEEPGVLADSRAVRSPGVNDAIEVLRRAVVAVAPAHGRSKRKEKRDRRHHHDVNAGRKRSRGSTSSSVLTICSNQKPPRAGRSTSKELEPSSPAPQKPVLLGEWLARTWHSLGMLYLYDQQYGPGLAALEQAVRLWTTVKASNKDETGRARSHAGHDLVHRSRSAPDLEARRPSVPPRRPASGAAMIRSSSDGAAKVACCSSSTGSEKSRGRSTTGNNRVDGFSSSLIKLGLAQLALGLVNQADDTFWHVRECHLTEFGFCRYPEQLAFMMNNLAATSYALSEDIYGRGSASTCGNDDLEEAQRSLELALEYQRMAREKELQLGKSFGRAKGTSKVSGDIGKNLSALGGAKARVGGATFIISPSNCSLDTALVLANLGFVCTKRGKILTALQYLEVSLQVYDLHLGNKTTSKLTEEGTWQAVLCHQRMIVNENIRFLVSGGANVYASAPLGGPLIAPCGGNLLWAGNDEEEEDDDDDDIVTRSTTTATTTTASSSSSPHSTSALPSLTAPAAWTDAAAKSSLSSSWFCHSSALTTY